MHRTLTDVVVTVHQGEPQRGRVEAVLLVLDSVLPRTRGLQQRRERVRDDHARNLMEHRRAENPAASSVHRTTLDAYVTLLACVVCECNICGIEVPAFAQDEDNKGHPDT